MPAPSSSTVPRLIVLGATEVHRDKRPADADYVILADPEGDRFCVTEAGSGAVARWRRAWRWPDLV